MDLTSYQVILVNTSAGKDSEAMLHVVCSMASQQGVLARVVAVHCDLGRMEWSGTRDLAQKQCDIYGIPLHVVSRGQDLLDHVESRGMWPSDAARYCTSDHKRDQVNVLITRLVNDYLLATYGRVKRGQPAVRILNCMGMRASESPDRAKLPVFERNKRASNGKRSVDNWLPIHTWSEADVWSLIRNESLPYHYAYDLGMPRLSCVFCIYAPTEALLLAGYHNPELLAQYVAVETKIGHSFKYKSATKKQPAIHEPLVQIQDALANGYVPGHVDGSLWSQCA